MAKVRYIGTGSRLRVEDVVIARGQEGEVPDDVAARLASRGVVEYVEEEKKRDSDKRRTPAKRETSSAFERKEPAESEYGQEDFGTTPERSTKTKHEGERGLTGL